jgi:apolipoprotein N-acyltransferase
MALIGGILYATGFPMFGEHLFILGPLLAFIFLNAALDKRTSWKKQLLIGWAFSFGFYSFGFYWIPFLLKEFGGLTPPFNYLLGIIFSFVILPQVYLFVLIRDKIKSIVGLAFIYALLEYFIPQQFPAHLGHTFLSLTPTFNLGLAPLFGSSVYSFIICLSGLSILKHIADRKIPKFHYSLLTILFLLSFGLSTKKNQALKDEELMVRIVQPNIGNFLKVESEKGSINSFKEVLSSYEELSTQKSVKPIDLIIWPETSFPTLIASQLAKERGQDITPPIIKEIIDRTQSEMYIGGYDFNMSSGSQYGYESDYNTGFYFSKTKELKDVYHKIKLIPFGEGLPFGPFNKFLSQYITNVSFFAKGDRSTLFTLPNKTTFVSAICYEILFPGFIRDTLNANSIEPHFLINLTNDSWYGDTFEPYQHLFLAKWRALEFNIPIIRSTNTGITSIIYPDGSESDRLLINEKKILDVDFKYQARSKTIFQQYGILVFIGLGIFIMILEKILLLKARVNE